jgi:cytochrome c
LELDAMDSFEMNKLLGAVLGTCLVLVALNIAAGAVFAPVKPAKPGYDIKVPGTCRSQHQCSAGATGGAANRRAARQRRHRARPGSCHPELRQLPHLRKGRREEGRPQSLWRGRAHEGRGGRFQLFDGDEEQGRHWSLDDLNHFLANPRGMVPGTQMTFGGLAQRRTG